MMLGSFNPTIFQPRWLGAQQLIRPEEAENAKITTIQAELADFSTEWFHLQVLQNRFQILSEDPRQYAPLRDLVGAICAILPHTPITALGLNRKFHFSVRSRDNWHGLGHLLAPKEPWNAIIDAPGLLSMVMQGRRKETDGGNLRVVVGPSQKVDPGVFMQINEEFLASKYPQPEGAQWIAGCLSEHWDGVMAFSEVVAEHLLGLVRN